MKSVIAIVLFLMTTTGWSQLQYPKASPLSSIEQEVGLSKISVSYSRPSAKGRKIFGVRADGTPGLVPNGRIWRVGANESTKVLLESDVLIKGQPLLKGEYALYAFPEDTVWQIVFHKNTDHWGDGRNAYNPLEDALRINVAPIKTLAFQESFLLYFDDITHNSLTMVLFWEQTKVQIPIEIDTRSVMEHQITKKVMDDPTAQTYYEIARYYQEEGYNYHRALEYVTKALELRGDTYYFHRVKSLLEAGLGDYQSAILSAQKSLALADKEGKDEFVRLNEKNMNDWNILLEKNKQN